MPRPRAFSSRLIPASAWRASRSKSNSVALPAAVPSTSITRDTAASGPPSAAARTSRASKRSLVNGRGACGFRSSQVSRSAAISNRRSRSSSVRGRSDTMGVLGTAGTLRRPRRSRFWISPAERQSQLGQRRHRPHAHRQCVIGGRSGCTRGHERLNGTSGAHAHGRDRGCRIGSESSVGRYVETCVAVAQLGPLDPLRDESGSVRDPA